MGDAISDQGGGGQDDLASTLLKADLIDFAAAGERIAGQAIRSPVLPFMSAGGRTIRLKAENLQPFGSFKIRAAVNVLGGIAAGDLARGVATASAGNFAQGLTAAARQRGVPMTVHLPQNAAETKRAALAGLGATLVVHSFDDWWRILVTRTTGANDGIFIHPVCEPGVVIGNGTIGLEILEQWPDVDTIVVPIGGGGLVSGIALAARARGRRVRIIGCEIETAAPVSAAFAAGRPVPVERRPSFIDGIGSTRVLDEMWPLLSMLVDDVVVVTLDEAEHALRTLASTSHLIVEGAGAAAVAAALSSKCPGTNVVAVLSGGNIDPGVFCDILRPLGERLPPPALLPTS